MPEAMQDNTATIEKVKALRLAIATVTRDARKLADEIGRGAGGREMSLAITKLQEAKMWGGKICEELGSAFPEAFRDEPAKEL